MLVLIRCVGVVLIRCVGGVGVFVLVGLVGGVV